MYVLIIVLFLIIFPLIYNVLVPMEYPDLQNYFKVGHVFTSKAEKVTQKVIRLEGDRLYSKITLDPGSPGPPEHVHLSMEETATITKGTLTTKIDGQTGILRAGERIILNKGHYHTFSNPTDEVVEITCTEDGDFVSIKFAFCLTKIYSIMDSGSNFKTIRLLLQLSVLHEWFDNYIAGPPIKIQNIMRIALRPYARVLGFRP